MNVCEIFKLLVKLFVDITAINETEKQAEIQEVKVFHQLCTMVKSNRV